MYKILAWRFNPQENEIVMNVEIQRVVQRMKIVARRTEQLKDWGVDFAEKIFVYYKMRYFGNSLLPPSHLGYQQPGYQPPAAKHKNSSVVRYIVDTCLLV